MVDKKTKYNSQFRPLYHRSFWNCLACITGMWYYHGRRSFAEAMKTEAVQTKATALDQWMYTYTQNGILHHEDCRLRSFYPWKRSKKSVEYCLGWTCQSGWSNLVICRGKERTEFLYCHPFLQFWPIKQSSLAYTYYTCFLELTYVRRPSYCTLQSVYTA